MIRIVLLIQSIIWLIEVGSGINFVRKFRGYLQLRQLGYMPLSIGVYRLDEEFDRSDLKLEINLGDSSTVDWTRKG